jgi:hypothetical protein
MRLIGYCDACRHYVADWHAGCHGAIRLVEDRTGDAYHALLGGACESLKGRRKPAMVVDIDEWRETAYPGYFMHSQTRQLLREAREVTLPNGTIRRYPEKMLDARNGSYSLTVDGKTSSRGINSLWKETFPEFGRKKKKKKDGEWDDTVTLRQEKLEQTEWVSEWIDEGGSYIVTRPK